MKSLFKTWLLFNCIFLICCNDKSEKTYKVTETYTAECADKKSSFLKVDIKSLMREKRRFDTRQVEITGVYRHGMERSAVYSDKDDDSDENAIWITFSENNLKSTSTGLLLLDLQSESKKIYDKKIRIGGTFDASDKGHLDEYGGGLTSICYIEILE